MQEIRWIYLNITFFTHLPLQKVAGNFKTMGERKQWDGNVSVGLRAGQRGGCLCLVVWERLIDMGKEWGGGVSDCCWIPVYNEHRMELDCMFKLHMLIGGSLCVSVVTYKDKTKAFQHHCSFKNVNDLFWVSFLSPILVGKIVRALGHQANQGVRHISDCSQETVSLFSWFYNRLETCVYCAAILRCCIIL